MNTVQRALLTAALFAVDPVALGGVCIHSCAQPLRAAWLDMLRDFLPAGTPMRRIPHNISDRQLFGGLDVSATLAQGRPVAESGQLAAAHGGVLVLAMAERLSVRTASCINSALDRREVIMPREGVMLVNPTEFGVVALDEGMGDDEAAPASLLDRLAFYLDLNAIPARSNLTPLYDRERIAAARRRVADIRLPISAARNIGGACQALGVESGRAASFALCAAKACAALTERTAVNDDDVLTAAELVISHRATRLPEAPAAAAAAPPRERERDSENESGSGASQDPSRGDVDTNARADADADAGELAVPATPLEAQVIAASQAAIPEGLLAQLRVGQRRSRGSSQTGRAGALHYSSRRGRPAGVRPGNPRFDGRLSLIDTLQAAAPWQRVRAHRHDATRIRVEYSDFRVARFRQRARTLIIFAVDASGSAALHRLAEAKGAVELVLAECYVRRDQVAVIGFRGQTAEVLLPPTRSLTRAKNSLAGLPGGGGTPLASGIAAALDMAVKAQRRGDTPAILLLTDGRANIRLDGSAGRQAAHGDALRAASAVRQSQIRALFIDTSLRPSSLAEEIATTMRARYVPLPSSDSRRILEILKSQA